MRTVSVAIVFMVVSSVYAAGPTPGASGAAPNAPSSHCATGAAPKTVEDWVRRGDCLRDEKDYKAAVDAYWRGLKVDPTGTRDLHLGLARAYDELGRYSDMYSSVQAALHLDSGDPETLYWLGIAYEDAKDYPLALETFQKVMTIRPNDVRAQRNIGFVLLQQNKPEEAIGALEAAIKIDPNDWKAHLNLASAYRRTRESFAEQLKALAEAGAHDVGPRQMEMEKLIRTFPYHAKYVEHSREAARLNPDDYITQYGLGTSLMDEPDALPAAIEALQRAASLRPEEYRVLHNLAKALQKAKRNEEAYETCKRMQKLSTNDKWLNVTMGQLEHAMGREQDAEKSYRTALQLDEKDWGVSLDLARILRRLGRDADAKQEIAKAKELNPELAPVIESYASHL